MNYGMGQKVNPHTVRVGVIKNFDSVWLIEDDIIDNQSKLYLKTKILGISLSTGLYDRKIKLIKMLGKNKYKKLVSKVKTISR